MNEISEASQNQESALFGKGQTPTAVKAPGLIDQITGVFTEPTVLFKKLAEAPSWAWAIGTLVVLSMILTVVWGLKVDVDQMLRPVLERNAQLSADQIETAISFQQRFVIAFGILGALFGTPIGILLMALIYWLIGMGTAENQKPNYLQSLSATAVSSLAMVPSLVAIILMCLLRPVGGLTPDKLAPTSLGFYIQPEHPKLLALFTSLEVFTLMNFVMIFLAARYTMRLKPAGAVCCSLVAVLFTVGFKVLFAR